MSENKIEGIELFIYKNQKGAFMEFIFLVSAIVIILCIASSGISNKYGVPSLLIFIFTRNAIWLRWYF